jgi:hypothetical protein
MRQFNLSGPVVAVCGLLLTGVRAAPAQAPAAPVKPLFRDFMGLNVHTVQFKPELYKPAIRLVRDYHGLNWDVGDDPSRPTTFPFAHNRVDWGKLYGEWKAAGYDINVSVMFSGTPHAAWKDLPRSAHQYGLAFARFFGPSGERKLVGSVEIGNEPGHYDDAMYRTLFENMARGFREGDPKLKIVTCAARPGPSGKYHKSLTTVKGLENLYDVINVHSYAEVEGYPTWRRSYPEDPSIKYLKDVQDTITWRDQYAPRKPVWVTEFGWDASTKPAPPAGTFAKWVGSTETQQAQYLVRSFLVFSEMAVERAYIFFFNDSDEPQVHGSSGLTRRYERKPAFHAVAHLHRTLGDYRFSRVVERRPGELYAYEYRHGADPRRRILAAWSPTGSSREAPATVPLDAALVEKAERMPLTSRPPAVVKWEAAGMGTIRLPVTESPVFIHFRAR